MRDIYIMPINYFFRRFKSLSVFSVSMGVKQTVKSTLQKNYTRLFLQTPSFLHGFGSFRAKKLMWSMYFILMLAWLNIANALGADITISSTTPLSLPMNASYSNYQTGGVNGDLYMDKDGKLGNAAPNVFLLAEPKSSLSGGSPSGRPHIATGRLIRASDGALGPQYWLTLASVVATMSGTIDVEMLGYRTISGRIDYYPTGFDTTAESTLSVPDPAIGGVPYHSGKSVFRPYYNVSFDSAGDVSFHAPYAIMRHNFNAELGRWNLRFKNVNGVLHQLNTNIFIETRIAVPPGKWSTVHTVKAAAAWANGPPGELILDKVNFTVAYPSCNLYLGSPNVKLTIPANNDSSDSQSVPWEVGCNGAGAPDKALKITASGGSNTNPASNKLSIINSQLINAAELWVEGSWNNTPKCNSAITQQTILFSGSPSPPIVVTQANTTRTKGVLGFVACKKGAVPPGDYNAKATIELVNQ